MLFKSISFYSKKRIINISIMLLLLIFCLAYLIPVYWLIGTSFKPDSQAMSWPPTFFPNKIVFDNYKIAVGEKSLFLYVKNSLIISISSVTLSIIIGIMAAFSFAYLKWKERTRTNILLLIIGLRIMPPITIAIPLFLIFAKLKLIDTYQAVICAYVLFNLPFVIWLLYCFFKELPNEIIEASLVDGCSLTQLITKIIIPLSMPSIVTVFLLTFIGSWNEWLFAVKLTSFTTKTIPALIGSFITDRGFLWGQICAVGTISILPVIIIALLIQRYIVSGLTFGAIK